MTAIIEVSDDQIKVFLCLIISFIAIILGLFERKKRGYLLKFGIRVNGVVFDLITEPSRRSGTIHYPVVRFVTTDLNWITKKYNAAREFGYYKEGAEVAVIYDPKNPENFILNDWSTKINPGLILVLAGIVGCIAAFYYLMLNI